MTAPATGVAMPEWLTRRDQPNGAWTVQEGAAQRGEAWTRIHERVMRVPFGGDETNRVIRAHEMMHARVSPTALVGTEYGISAESIVAAEEFRVNTLIKHAGFDLDFLVDGSESRSGKRLAEMGDHAGLVRAVAATGGSKACKDMLRGVKAVDADLAKNLRELEKSLVKKWTHSARRNADRTAREWGSTLTESEYAQYPGYLSGYANYTLPIARVLDDLINALDDSRESGDDSADEEDGDKQGMDASLVRDMLADTPGRFANLTFGTTRVSRKAQGNLGRKRIAANTGVNPRRLNRMLTDPQRRVFDRKQRVNGGIIVIDMSGSMRLERADIERLMEASPGCTIVGYSHNGRTEDCENAWVLARDGRRVENLPTAPGGNGVDGPVIEWAAEQVKRSEPFVWVCDGLVTSCEDQVHVNLDVACANLVRKFGVHMVPTVGRAIDALHDLRKGRRLPTKYSGNVWKAANRLGYVRS
jgi:hypothetical protein